jgi:hypothetical protein
MDKDLPCLAESFKCLYFVKNYNLGHHTLCHVLSTSTLLLIKGTLLVPSKCFYWLITHWKQQSNWLWDGRLGFYSWPERGFSLHRCVLDWPCSSSILIFSEYFPRIQHLVLETGYCFHQVLRSRPCVSTILYILMV